jgi:hypothetical protein
MFTLICLSNVRAAERYDQLPALAADFVRRRVPVFAASALPAALPPRQMILFAAEHASAIALLDAQHHASGIDIRLRDRR